MLKRSWIYLPLTIVALLFAACQTAKPLPPDPLAGNASTFQSEARGLSPNDDGFADAISLSLFVGQKELLTAWGVEIRSEGRTLRSYQGLAPAPAEFLWDGKDDKGAIAPEGRYSAVASLSFTGASSALEVSTKAFVLDASPPRGSIAIDPPAGLVPAHGGVAAPLGISIKAESALAAIDSWSLDIMGPDGKRFSAFSGKWPAAAIRWDGKSGTGAAVTALSSYSAILTIRDEFGLEGRSTSIIPVADLPASPERIGVEARRKGFSPTSVSVKNTLDLLLTFGRREYVKSWSVSVISPTVGLKREFKGSASSTPEFVAWDGMDQSGKPAPAGNYYALLAVDYGDAFKPISAKSSVFAVVTNAPKGSLSIDPAELEFDGRGALDTATIIVRPLKSAAAIASWTMTIAAPDGSAMATFSATWPEDKASWDGRDPAGNVADPGKKYAVTSLVRDEYGNEGRFTGIIAIGELPEVNEITEVIPQSAGFSPNGDGVMDGMVLALSYGERDSLLTWKLEIARAGAGGEAAVVRSYDGIAATLPSSISWDGLNDAGAKAPEGAYRALLSVGYGKVFEAIKVASVPFARDVTAPKVKLATSPELFSPDGDGEGDTATFKIVPDGAERDIESWTMSVFDPAGNLFVSFNGDWPTDQVGWDGKGLDGGLVESAEDYLLRARIEDRFGNVTEIKKALPIDILVIKTDSGYRIRIASIVFKAFTADFVNVLPDRAKRNQATLALLARKLAKFPDYGIAIVGHAVMINWDDAAAGQAEQDSILLPLSRERAAAIKATLVQRGIPAKRIGTDGVGASDQAVPDSDLANRWKNRRVDFILEK